MKQVESKKRSSYKKLILLLIFIIISSYKSIEPIDTEYKLKEIRQNLYMAEKDLYDVSIIISDEKNLKKIQKKIRNESN